jgi:hypothetical protein
VFNMISPVSNAVPSQSPVQPTAASQGTPQAKAPAPAPAAVPVKDTVQLSGAKAVVQETLETPGQTAKEASAGDVQARRLLAKEAAARIK